MQQPSSTKIWAFLAGMFWVSIVTYVVLWRSYRRIVDMRDRIQASAYARPQQFVVLVRDIPKQDQTGERPSETPLPSSETEIPPWLTRISVFAPE
jgi:hypothetical protein